MNSENINSNISSANVSSGNLSRPGSSVKPNIKISSNSDYKRPASTLSARSQQKEEDESLQRDWCGLTLLSFHVFIATLLLLSALFAVIWEIACRVLKIVHSVEGIPQTVTLLMALVTFVALAVSFWLPIRLVLSGSTTFKKLYSKEHKIHFWSSIGIAICGVTCVCLHFYLISYASASHMTPFLPGGLFLILNGLLNLKINYELVGVKGDDQAILLPYVPEKCGDEDEMEMEMLNVSSSGGSSVGVMGYDRPDYNNNV